MKEDLSKNRLVVNRGGINMKFNKDIKNIPTTEKLKNTLNKKVVLSSAKQLSKDLKLQINFYN